jgi:hypothetical protein
MVTIVHRLTLGRINQRDSFQDVVRLREMIFRVKPPMLQSERLPIVIVGSESDRRQSSVSWLIG